MDDNDQYPGGYSPLGDLAAAACHIAETIEKIKTPSSKRQLKRVLEGIINVVPETQTIRVVKVYFNSEDAGESAP
jgi:hypothetical protein